jgi:hypothetical protein
MVSSSYACCSIEYIYYYEYVCLYVDDKLFCKEMYLTKFLKNKYMFKTKKTYQLKTKGKRIKKNVRLLDLNF